MIDKTNFANFFDIMEEFHTKLEQKMHSQLKGTFGEMTITHIKACMVIDKAEQIRMSDFAKIMLLKTSGATQLVDRLAELGYVKREVDSSDRRITFVSLEKQMKLKIKKMKTIESEVLKEEFGKLNTAEFQMLTSLIQKLL
jgi:DNA-binding MarR family transcriptional regulator